MTESALPTDELARLRPGLEFAEFGHELVVFDPARHMVHHVEGLVAVVVDAMRTGTSRAQLAEELSDELDMPNDRALAELRGVEALLDAAVLLESSEEPPGDGPPCIGCSEGTPPEWSGSRPRWRRRSAVRG